MSRNSSRSRKEVRERGQVVQLALVAIVNSPSCHKRGIFRITSVEFKCNGLWQAPSRSWRRDEKEVAQAGVAR